MSAPIGRRLGRGWILLAVIALAGCQSRPRNYAAIRSYYEYDFTSAREALRGNAYLRNDEMVLLNNVRLGAASLADGDLNEAERALGRSFDLLSTAGLNQDRTTAAVLIQEDVRIWKGEPFEQALTYYYVAALYAVRGDWENTRAAATNALFRLTDFGSDQTPEKLVRNAAKDPEYLERGYRAVDSDFALGFLMQAIGSDHSGAAGSEQQFDAAVQINPDLEPLVDTLRFREYDTLLIVDYGKGPTKIAYGPDDALARFDPQEQGRGPLLVNVDGIDLAPFGPVCDVDQMAVDLRWNNLEDVRRAKSFIGDVLVTGGAIVASSSSYRDSHDDQMRKGLIGAGMMIAGFLTKAGARADTRYLEFAPRSVYLVPLLLEQTSVVRLHVQSDPDSMVILPDVRPGTEKSPRAIYLRVNGVDGPDPEWLIASAAVYGNDHTGVRPGDWPWILGGHDVSTPSRAVLQAYQAGGHLLDLTVEDLRDLYRAEGIILGSGMANRPDAPRNPSFRHILEGGTGLFTPEPDSMGYKRLMYTPRPAYRPKSELARNLARGIRVQEEARNEESTR